jgi:hypothetical protein
MYFVNIQSLENDFIARLKGIVQDHSFFPSYYHILPNIILINQSKVRRIDTSLSSNNNISTTTEKQRIGLARYHLQNGYPNIWKLRGEAESESRTKLSDDRRD